MTNVDTIKELIDQMPEIKALFSKERFDMCSWYDHATGQRRSSGIELETIYKHPKFLQWKEALHYELVKLSDDSFISGIIKLLGDFCGFSDKARFEKLESKLLILKNHLNEYEDNSSAVKIKDDSRIPEKEICARMLRAISKLQRNHNYNASSSEDTMNDYIRDLLDENYLIKDQTRQGESESGSEAGEVDIQICCDGLPVVMIEGIKVSSLETDRLAAHMNKVLTKYDPNGCPYAFLIIYTTVKDFVSGYEKVFSYFDEYDYPFPKETNLVHEDTGYGELKHAEVILNRNGQKVRVHIWTAHII